jgi:hypothetical protein
VNKETRPDTGERVEPKVPVSGTPPVPWVLPGKPPPGAPVVRVALVSTVLWVLFGLGVAYVSALLGAPQASASLALLIGVPVVWVVGRRAGLHSRGSWVRAVLLTIVFAWLLFGVGIVAYSILLYG